MEIILAFELIEVGDAVKTGLLTGNLSEGGKTGLLVTIGVEGSELTLGPRS